MFDLALNIAFLFVVSLLFALVEIELEAKNGWAQHLPTWYRTKGIIPSIYAVMMNGKPLTGYHLFMFFLPLVMFHAPFFMGTPFTLTGELYVLLNYFVFAPLWDYLWFVLNPYYTVKYFKKEYVWWHAKSHWLFNAMPHDHIVGWLSTVVIAGIISYLDKSWTPLIHHGVRLGVLTALTLVCVALAPAYEKWYFAMRKRDDRDEVKFFFPPDKK